MKSNKKKLLSNKKINSIYNLKSLKKHTTKQKSMRRPKEFKFKQVGGDNYKDLDIARKNISIDKKRANSGSQQHRYREYTLWLLDLAELVFGTTKASKMVKTSMNHAKTTFRDKYYVDRFENTINSTLEQYTTNLINKHDNNIYYKGGGTKCMKSFIANVTETDTDDPGNLSNIKTDWRTKPTLEKYVIAYIYLLKNSEYTQTVLFDTDSKHILNTLIENLLTEHDTKWGLLSSSGSRRGHGGKTKSGIYNPYMGGDVFINQFDINSSKGENRGWTTTTSMSPFDGLSNPFKHILKTKAEHINNSLYVLYNKKFLKTQNIKIY